MSSNAWYRAPLRVLGAAVTGVGVLALSAAALGGGMLQSAPEAEEVAAPAVEVAAAPLTLVCPPAPAVPTGDGGDIDYDDQFGTGGGDAQVQTQVVVLGRNGPADVVSAGELGAEPEEVPASGTARVFSSTSPAPVSVVAAPSAEASALVAGAGLARSDTGDLRGLAAASCVQPTSSAWLVGGQTEAGSSARLTLANPGQTPVNVTAQLWGDTGRLDQPVSVTIPADDTRQVLLEASSMEPRLAVHVSVDGGAVAASIQDTVLNGLVPAGTATVTPTQAPNTELLLGPVPVNDTSGTATLRLVNPGDDPATVDLDVLGAEGPAPLAGGQDLVLEAQTVVDVALDGIDAGYVSLAAHSDQPVTGGIVVAREGQPSELDPDQAVIDRAWMPATVPAEHGLLPVVGVGSLVDWAEVALTNPGTTAAQVSVRTIAADGTPGEASDVSVPAGATAMIGDQDTLGLADAVAVEITGDPVLASLTLAGHADNGNLVGVLPLTADADSQQSIRVRLSEY